MRGERKEWSHLLVMVSGAQNAELHFSIHAMYHFSIAGILLVHCGIGCRLSVAVVMGHPPVVCV